MATGVHTPNTPDHYYSWRVDHRRHLSVGAVIVNEQDQILVLRLERVDGKYFMPTRSHLPERTLEESLAQVEKRTGWKAKLDEFLGVVASEFPIPEGGTVTKYTIWFKCTPQGEVPRDPEDRDTDATIEWKSRAELEEIFAGQASISSDVDQRNVLALLDA